MYISACDFERTNKIDRKIDAQIERWIDIKMNRKIDAQIERYIDRFRWIDRKID